METIMKRSIEAKTIENADAISIKILQNTKKATGHIPITESL